jgi:hypothetical protein
MKTPLLLISIPLAISFLGGMFYWEMEEGMVVLFGLSMIIGTIWAWVIELKK